MGTQLRWTRGKYNSSRAQAGAISLGVCWGVTRGDGFVASCDALGIQSKGHASMEAAQEVLEAMVRAALDEARRAFGGGL